MTATYNAITMNGVSFLLLPLQHLQLFVIYPKAIHIKSKKFKNKPEVEKIISYTEVH